MLLVLTMALAAAPADVERCRAALNKVESHDAPERIDAFQACGGLLGDQSLRTAWFAVVHSSPFDAAVNLANAAGEPVPGGAPNACARTKSDLPICGAKRDEVLRLRAPEKAVQWRTLFLRLLAVDLTKEQAAQLEKPFFDKWPLLFPDAPPPGVSNDGPLKVSGNIDRRAVMLAIGAVRPEMTKCLAAPQASLTLKWTVTAQGKVTGFFVLDPTEADRGACIAKAFKKAVMPKPIGGGVAIIVWTSEYYD
jgi:hypothetical protein